jgi:hypothetical protein
LTAGAALTTGAALTASAALTTVSELTLLSELALLSLSPTLALLHLSLHALHERVHGHLQFGRIQRFVTVLVELGNHHLGELCPGATAPSISFAVLHLCTVAWIRGLIAGRRAVAFFSFAAPLCVSRVKRE